MMQMHAVDASFPRSGAMHLVPDLQGFSLNLAGDARRAANADSDFVHRAT
jgi:hypothetical protein